MCQIDGKFIAMLHEMYFAADIKAAQGAFSLQAGGYHSCGKCEALMLPLIERAECPVCLRWPCWHYSFLAVCPEIQQYMKVKRMHELDPAAAPSLAPLPKLSKEQHGVDTDAAMGHYDEGPQDSEDSLTSLSRGTGASNASSGADSQAAANSRGAASNQAPGRAQQTVYSNQSTFLLPPIPKEAQLVNCTLEVPQPSVSVDMTCLRF